jgi:hypothetical protein
MSSEKNYLNNPGELKIDLMLRGTRIEDPVVKAWACGATGIDLLLPKGTLVNVACSDYVAETSPYSIKKSGRGHVMTFDGADGEVPVKFVPKPEFYHRNTTTGVPFSRIADIHGRYTVITPSPRCDFFNSNVECRYCAGNFDVRAGSAGGAGGGPKGPVAEEAGGVARDFTVDEILETVELVLKERASEIIYLSIGFAEGEDGGMEFLAPYIQAVKKHFSCLVAVEAMPPKHNHWIDETYALGADSVLYNLEIFDPELFEILCPGRAELIGRRRYIDALKYAAGIFPNGTVASHLIVGLEPPGSTTKGVDFLVGLGVVPILPVFRPSKDRSLGIDPLDTEIIIPVYKHLYRALKGSDINFKWVRDISMVTTPVEGRLLMGEDEAAGGSLLDNFYKTKLGLKAAWGLSTLRRKLRVKEGSDTGR